MVSGALEVSELSPAISMLDFLLRDRDLERDFEFDLERGVLLGFADFGSLETSEVTVSLSNFFVLISDLLGVVDLELVCERDLE